MKLKLFENSNLPVLHAQRFYFLEKLIKYYSRNSERLGEERCRDITTAIVEEVSNSLDKSRVIPFKTLKLFLSEIYATGNFFKNIDLDHFYSLIDSMYRLMGYEENEEIERIVVGIRETELSKLKKRFDDGVETEPDDLELKKLSIMMEQAGYFWEKEDESVGLIDYLYREKYQIDLQKGTNSEKAIHCVYNGAMNYLSLYHMGLIDKFADPKLVSYYLDILKARIEFFVNKYPDEPENILLNEPFILELYNMAHSTIIIGGEERPNDEINKRIKRVLSVLPKPEPIDPEEEQEFEEDCQAYNNSIMTQEKFMNFSITFSKKLYAAIYNESLEDEDLVEGADVLLGQFGLNNPVVLDPENGNFQSGMMRLIVTTAFWCYANNIVQKSLTGKEKRIDMVAMKNEPETDGGFTNDPYTFYFSPFINNRDKLLTEIASVHHETKHATDENDIENNIYRGKLEYLGNKLSIVNDYIPILVGNIEYNYDHSSYEIAAWDTGYRGAYDFAERHGILVLDDIQELIDQNSELMENSNIIRNPAFNLETTRWKLLKTQTKRKISAFTEDRQTVFNKLLYSEWKKESNKKEVKKAENAKEMIERESELLSFGDGRNVNIEVLFDRYVKLHPEICEEGSYFSIEYYPDGRRKELKQILADLNEVPEGDENFQKREVYRHIIEDRILKDGNPAKNLKALMKYKPTNGDNSILIEEIVEDNIDTMLSRLRLHFLREGDTSGKMNNALQYIGKLCSVPDLAQTPFAKGVISSGILDSKRFSVSNVFLPIDIGKKCFGSLFDRKNHDLKR